VAQQTKPKQKKLNENKVAKDKKDKILKTTNFTVTLDFGAAKKQLNEMHSKITLIGVKTLIWYFNKVFRHAI